MGDKMAGQEAQPSSSARRSWADFAEPGGATRLIGLIGFICSIGSNESN